MGTVDTVVRVKRGGWLTYAEEGIPEGPSKDQKTDHQIDTLAAELVAKLRRTAAPVQNRDDLNALLRGSRQNIVKAVSRAITGGLIAKIGNAYKPVEEASNVAAE